MSNQKTNLEICEKLIEFFRDSKNKDLRFFQALSNMGLFTAQYDDRLNITGVQDPFYMQNEAVIIKIQNELKK